MRKQYISVLPLQCRTTDSKLHNILAVCVSSITEVQECHYGFTLWTPHGPLIRYVKLRVAHAPGMPGTFYPPPTLKETTSKRYQHVWRHVRPTHAMVHVGIASLWWRGKRSQLSRRVGNPKFYASGKRPMVWCAKLQGMNYYAVAEQYINSKSYFAKMVVQCH